MIRCASKGPGLGWVSTKYRVGPLPHAQSLAFKLVDGWQDFRAPGRVVHVCPQALCLQASAPYPSAAMHRYQTDLATPNPLP